MSPSKHTPVSFDTFPNVIGGELRQSKQKYNGVDPSTGENLWDVPVASREDVEDAVAFANKAFPAWSQTTWDERKALLSKYKDLLVSYNDEFYELFKKECGKPPMMADFETKTIPKFIDYHNSLEEIVEKYEDEEKTITTRYVPLGVVAAICPWNYPALLAIGKIIPALLSGNCIIVKPSPFTPYSSLKLAEIAQQVFPPGVFQSLGGDDSLGPQFVTHPNVHKISFTGSIATGKKIMQAAAPTLKRVTLELGGNDACIVLPDVDIMQVAPQVVMGSFMNSGQVCIATKRIYIHESIYEPFVQAMVAVTQTLKVGNPSEEGVMVGPVQNKMQYDRVKGFFEDSKAKGYKFATGASDVPDGKGYFIAPTIIDNPPNDSRIIQEEPFGPIVPTQPYSSETEVISRANDTNTGLGAVVWGKDVEHAQRVARQLQAGSVFVNSFEKPAVQAAFGGVKESGIGTEFGPRGYLSFCNPQAMHVYK